jgi:hypothetical protein
MRICERLDGIPLASSLRPGRRIFGRDLAAQLTIDSGCSPASPRGSVSKRSRRH